MAVLLWRLNLYLSNRLSIHLADALSPFNLAFPYCHTCLLHVYPLHYLLPFILGGCLEIELILVQLSTTSLALARIPVRGNKQFTFF